jgi:hypothetical protein
MSAAYPGWTDLASKPVRMKLIGCFLGFLSLLPLVAMPVHAADKPKAVKYVPPEGLAGHKWNELRTSFDRLPTEPIGVGAAWMMPVEKEVTFNCIPVANTGGQINGAVEGCDFQATLLQLHRIFEGGGFYVLSEYTIEDQGIRYGDEADGVVLHPIIYQFCANWHETKREVPPKFDEINKFCGVRLMFKSDTREQLRGKPAEYVTNYDRMLDKLLAKFGKPANFAHRGRVVIETLEGESSDQADRKFSIYRWCPARDTNGLHTDCTASVVLSLDPATGVGTVLYSTPLLWEFAYAREKDTKGDRLYKMLHARK